MNTLATMFTKNTQPNPPLPDEGNNVILQVVEFWEDRVIWKFFAVN